MGALSPLTGLPGVGGERPGTHHLGWNHGEPRDFPGADQEFVDFGDFSSATVWIQEEDDFPPCFPGRFCCPTRRTQDDHPPCPRQTPPTPTQPAGADPARDCWTPAAAGARGGCRCAFDRPRCPRYRPGSAPRRCWTLSVGFGDRVGSSFLVVDPRTGWSRHRGGCQHGGGHPRLRLTVALGLDGVAYAASP